MSKDKPKAKIKKAPAKKKDAKLTAKEQLKKKCARLGLRYNGLGLPGMRAPTNALLPDPPVALSPPDVTDNDQ